MDFSTTIIELIQSRRSVRNYDSMRSLSFEQEEKIRKILENHTIGPMGNKVHFHLIHANPEDAKQKIKMGTYGFIKGARHYIAGEIIPNKPYAEEDYGYLMEIIMLHLLDEGLGTCWLGGTFKRKQLTHIMDTKGVMIIPAITPLGYPAKNLSRRERLIRKGAGADSRKAWHELFFDENFGTPLQLQNDHAMHLALEMLRIGPSASNKQPWRVIKDGNTYHLFLSKTPGYGRAFKSFEIQKLDMGIAMAHFELSCTAQNTKGQWKIQEHSIAMPEGTSYIASWIPEESTYLTKL